MSDATRATELRQLVAFLLSIDGDTMEIAAPATVTVGSAAPFDPNPCAQFR